MVANIPRVGMRMVKTALAVAICFFLYVLRGEEGVPIFSTIAAIICMQPYAENSIQVSINRIIGTLLGAVFALLVLYLIQYIPYQVRILRYLVISFAVIPVMYVTVLLKRTGASALAGIVLLSVCLSNVHRWRGQSIVLLKRLSGFWFLWGSIICICHGKGQRTIFL